MVHVLVMENAFVVLSKDPQVPSVQLTKGPHLVQERYQDHFKSLEH
jgi:hypothetical protein